MSRGLKRPFENDEESTTDEDEEIELPGGTAVTAGSKCVGYGTGEIPKPTLKLIRRFLDIAFGAGMIEMERLPATNKRVNSMYAIPGIVCAILDYNNQEFKSITCDFHCKIELFETVWYSYDLEKSELNLFVNEQMYDEICKKNNYKSVLFSAGIIPLELLNPHKVNPLLSKIDWSLIHCVIVSDHVAQHILSDLLNPKKLPCDGIHGEDFLKKGTTIHSMLRIERICKPQIRNHFGQYIPPQTVMTSSSDILNTLFPPYNSETNDFTFQFTQ